MISKKESKIRTNLARGVRYYAWQIDPSRIRKALDVREKTIKSVARSSGATERMMYKYASGIVNVRGYYLKRIAQSLGVNPSYLVIEPQRKHAKAID